MKQLENGILLNSIKKYLKLDSHIQKTCVRLDNFEQRGNGSDYDRLMGCIKKEKCFSQQDLSLSQQMLYKLPHLLTKEKNKITLVTEKNEILNIEKDDTTNKLLGFAFDVGTNIIEGYLLDLLTGNILSIVSTPNPQVCYGSDVISRIAFVATEENGLEKLHKCLIDSLNELIGKASKEACVSRGDIYTLVFAGNTCMRHLFLGINSGNLSFFPFIPVTHEPVSLPAKELAIEINEIGKIYVLPNIAGFIGGDTVATILATRMSYCEDVELVIDIGTNVNFVLKSKDSLFACSVAAAPAFEGNGITCGMRNIKGAIHQICFEDTIKFSVIGNVNPCGISGSGLIDCVAELINHDIIDSKGKILSPYENASTKAEKFKNNVVQYKGSNAFLLVDEYYTAHGRPILITQSDIRELQLAKASFSSGIHVLMQKVGIQITDISRVLLACPPQNHINLQSACIIGMIPFELKEKIIEVGNAAGIGAVASLLSRREYQHAALIPKLVKYVDLSSNSNFSSFFTAFLGFSHNLSAIN